MPSRNDTYEFGPFCLNATERVLLREDRIVPLSPKALSTLLVLLKNKGHLVEKHVLMQEVWPEEDVEEGNLAQHIFILRRALGEDRQYIETVPRRGYRFLSAEKEERHPSKRHTENSDAYQAYLNGRYHWSKHTREGLELSIVHFREALKLDSNYALAYVGLVDCYLRLATNYLPRPEALPQAAEAVGSLKIGEQLSEAMAVLRIRCEWDRKSVERECKRAGELKAAYPSAHQWHAAYVFSRELYQQTVEISASESVDVQVPAPSQYSRLTPDEEAQVFCVVAIDQMLAGNYEASAAALERWWTFGEWPRLAGLSLPSSADLLFTVGTVAGCLALARQIPRGQKHAEALLNGAIGLFEQLGSQTRAAEGRLELALCYYREGMFDLARATLMAAPVAFSDEGRVLKGLALILSALIERHAGRLQAALALLQQTAEPAESFGPWAGAFYHQELANTLNQLTTPDTRLAHLDETLMHYRQSLELFEAIGNYRHAAVVENNLGTLLLAVGRLKEAEACVVRSRKLYDSLGDKVRRAQADDTLAQLYLAAGRFEPAAHAALEAVTTLETGEQEAFLAESLTTQGLVLCKLGRYREAKRILDRAHGVAERCGDRLGAGRALLTEIEQMCDRLEDEERLELDSRLDRLLAHTQEASTITRFRKCRELIAAAHASHKAQTAGI